MLTQLLAFLVPHTMGFSMGLPVIWQLAAPERPERVTRMEMMVFLMTWSWE